MKKYMLYNVDLLKGILLYGFLILKGSEKNIYVFVNAILIICNKSFM